MVQNVRRLEEALTKSINFMHVHCLIEIFFKNPKSIIANFDDYHTLYDHIYIMKDCKSFFFSNYQYNKFVFPIFLVGNYLFVTGKIVLVLQFEDF